MKDSSVLIVGLNYAPEPVGIGPYTQGLAEALAARGAQVRVVCGQPFYPHWRIDAAYAGSGWSADDDNGVKVTRCPHFVPAQPSGLKRILHLASFASSALLPALIAALRTRRDKPDLVIAIAPALPSVFTAWLAARLSGAMLWIHVQDFEVEVAMATGLLGKGSPLAHAATWVERRLLALGEAVSTISPQMCRRLIDKGIAPDRVLEMRNWLDDRFVPDPDGASTIRTAWNLRGKTVALYSGNIARKQGIEIVIAAARLLEKRHDIVFVICGEGPNRGELEQNCAGLSNVLLRDLQPAGRMGAMMAMADLHLLPQLAEAADLVLPSKLINMLASGRPVIATCAPGTGLFAEVEGCGMNTPPGDAAALAGAIAELADDPLRRHQLGAAAVRRAEERWHKDAIIDRALAFVRTRMA